MSVSPKTELYLVELRTKGWSIGISKMPEERVLTTIFRLSKEQKNRLQGLKVRFYRLLDRHAVFTLGEKYVIPRKHLADVEAGFKEIYRDFLELRKEIYDELVSRWDEIKAKLEEYCKAAGLDADVDRLKPTGEDFLEMYYTVTPLSLTINQLVNLSEEFEKLAKERDEYRSLAERLRREAERMVNEVRAKYEEKIAEMNKLVEKLREALRSKAHEAYALKLRLGEVTEEAEEIASFLGEETVEDLKAKLEALKEVLASGLGKSNREG